MFGFLVNYQRVWPYLNFYIYPWHYLAQAYCMQHDVGLIQYAPYSMLKMVFDLGMYMHGNIHILTYCCHWKWLCIPQHSACLRKKCLYCICIFDYSNNTFEKCTFIVASHDALLMFGSFFSSLFKSKIAENFIINHL